MVAVAKKIIVRAFNGEVETFNGKNLIAKLGEYGRILYVEEEDSESPLGIFLRWEYVRNAD